MLLKLSKEIAGCYRHAAECREEARLARDPVTKEEYLEMEQRWLLLARSHEFTQRLRDFAEQNRPKHKRGRSISAKRQAAGEGEKP